MNWTRAIGLFLCSLIFTPFAIIIAVALAGAGHGSYFAAKILFPYTMLYSHRFESITYLLMALAVVQFPIYGILLTLGELKRRTGLTAILIFMGHLIAVVLCFVIPMPEFH